MFLTILIVIISLVLLLTIHEFGHFILAKKFGVEVEEFGIGYPPRLFGKKIGETFYSLNLLPFGAFVKIKGEEGQIEDSRSFPEKPIWQRALIVLGGVVSFWIVAFIIFSLISGVWGLPTAVSDDFPGESNVQIVGVSKDSPALKADLKMGDIIRELKIENEKLGISKIKEIQEFSETHKGEEIVLTIQRGGEISEVSLIPRVSSPEDEGAIGVALVRVSKVKYSWSKSLYIGAVVTYQKTIQIPIVLGGVFRNFLKGEKTEGVELMGPIGVVDVMGQALNTGVDSFLILVAMIAVWLALFNILPIPALDGGKLLFLIIEGIRKKPISQKIEQGITIFCFVCLLVLMFVVTIKDVLNLL